MRFGALGTNTHLKMAGGKNGWVAPVCHYVTRLVAIVGRLNSENCIIYLLKQF